MDYLIYLVTKLRMNLLKLLNYDNYTYIDIINTIKKFGISTCNDKKLHCQQMKNIKKSKYEMGNFCEQFGFHPIAPSRLDRSTHSLINLRNLTTRKNRDNFYKKSSNFYRKKPFGKKKSS